MAARDALGSGGLGSSSSGGSSPAIDIPNHNGAREGETSAHGRVGAEDVAVISPRYVHNGSEQSEVSAFNLSLTHEL